MNRRDALVCLLGGVCGGVGVTLTHCTEPPKTATVKPEGWSPPPKDGTVVYDISHCGFTSPERAIPIYMTPSVTWYLPDGRPL
jgi:hypothetical protein